MLYLLLEYIKLFISMLTQMNIILRGIGQVMFQGNALSGALMLLGIACSSPTMAVLSVFGTLFSTLAAYVFGFSRQHIRDGLYGFNGTLVGIAVGCFMNINALSMCLLVVGSVLSTLLAYMFTKQRQLSGFTAPFVVITWILLFLMKFFPELSLANTSSSVAMNTLDPLRGFSLNIGQVMFQGENIATGLLFLLGIAVNSFKMAWYASLGSLISLACVWLPFVKISDINSGLLGYNSVLVFMAVAGVAGIRRYRYMKAFIGVGLSVLLQCLGFHFGVVTLTAPFVLASWIVIVCSKATE